VPHARALACLAGTGPGPWAWAWCGMTRRAGGAVGWTDGDDSLMVNITVGCQWSLNRDSYQEPLNCDSYSALTATVTTWGALTVTSRFIPPAPVARFYKAPSSSPFGCQFTNQVLLFRRPLSSPSDCCFFLHLHRLHHAHGTDESRAFGTSPCCWDPSWDRRAIRFLESVFTRLVSPVRLLPLRRRQANERLLPLHRLRADDYFTYSWFALRSSTCNDCVRLLRLRSLTMGDNGNLGDAVTQTSTGYSLKQMFMFISCIIINIVMFNSCLNIHTCTWIVSLTTLLKCLLNYGIKICQNVAYHLTKTITLGTSEMLPLSRTLRRGEERVKQCCCFASSGIVVFVVYELKFIWFMDSRFSNALMTLKELLTKGM
jgi:hypothetical protein